MTKAELNSALLLAHELNSNSEDKALTLVSLYRQAYELSVNENTDAAYFYLTNAYVYALESDHVDVEQIANTLRQAGRL